MDTKIADAIIQLRLDYGQFPNGARAIGNSLESISAATRSATANVVGLQSHIDTSSKKWSEFSLQVGAAALGFTGTMGLIYAINKVRQGLADSVKDWAQYRSAMQEVSTLVDTSIVNMGELSDSVVALSNKYGKDKKGLANALYETISSGIDAGKSIQFMDTAIQAAIGGVTDAKTVVDGLTSSIAAYGQNADKAMEYSDSLFVTIKLGKTRMDELAGTIGQVAPLANAVGVSFDDLGNSMATLTLSGLGTSEAGTAMRGIFNAILQPSEDAKKMAKELGIEFDVASLRTKGFAKFLADLREKTGGSTSALAMLFPEVRGLNGAIQLTGDGFSKFNKNMDDYVTKAGQTTQASQKMRESLSQKWDTATNNFKNMGSGIGQYLEGPLKSALDTYNTLSNALNQGNRNMKVLSMNSNDMTLEQLKERLKVTKDTQAEVQKSEDARIKRLSSLGNDPFMGNVNKEKVLSQSELVKGVNAEVEALETLIRKKEVAAQGEALYTAEKEKAAKEETARQEKELVNAKANADAKAKLLADKDNSAKEAEKNASVLQQIEDDKLKATEKMTSLTSDASKQEIEDRKKAAEAIQKYDQLAFDSKTKYIEKQIDDQEYIRSNDRSTLEEKQQAAKKEQQLYIDLFNVKKQSSASAKTFELNNLKETVAQEKIQYEQRSKEIEQYVVSLENEYKKKVVDIEASTLPNKKILISNLRDDLAIRVEALGGLENANNESFKKVEENGKQTAQNIGKEFVNQLSNNYETTVKASVQISDKSKRDVTDTVNKWSGAMSSAMSLAMKAFSANTSVEIESLIGDIGHLVGSLGESSGNAYVAVIGEVLGTAGDVFSMLDEEFDIWGNQAKEKAKKEKELFNSIVDSMDIAIRKTEEWLNTLNQEDLSNKSVVELKQDKSQIYDKMASDVSSMTGIKGFSGENWDTMASLIKKRDYNINWEEPEVSLKAGAITKDEYDLMIQLKKENPNMKNGQWVETRLLDKAMRETMSVSQPTISKINKAIENRSITGNIDHTKSTTKEDFLADLQTELDTGRITEKEYKKQLYDASWGLGEYENKTWNGEKTKDNFNPEDQNRYEYDYVHADDNKSTDQGVQIFGAEVASTYRSAPTSLVGDSAIASAIAPQNDMNININVNNYIDPNIPINQDTALVYSEQIATSLSKVLASKGA